MRVAVWHTSDGPVAACTLPEDGSMPDVADAPGGPYPGARGAILAKGDSVSWPDYGDHLVHSMSHRGRWGLEDVPDGSAASGLAVVRDRATAQFAS